MKGNLKVVFTNVLQKAIISNLKDFNLEFGKDFTFPGEEYPIQVGNEEYFIDLLLFHRELQCLVAIELKYTGIHIVLYVMAHYKKNKARL